MAAEANYVRIDVQHLGPLGQDGGSSSGASKLGTTTSHIGGSESSEGSESSSGTHQSASHQEQQQQQEQGQHADVDTESALTQPPRRQLLCTVRGLLKKVRQRVLVGDVVAIAGIDWAAGRGVVEGVAPRSSELVDPAVANVDHVVLLFGLTQPPFEEQQVSRFLVSIEASGLPLTLALNKADLVPEEEVEARVAQCAAWGYRAVPVSCASGRGLDALGAVLAGKMSVVAGPSGAGKSSLINALRLGRHRVDDFGAEEGFGGGGSWADGGAAEEEAEQDGCSGSRDEEHDRGSEQEEEEGEQRWHSERAASGAAAGSSGGGAGSSDFLVVGDMSRFGRGKHTTRVVRLIPLPGGGLMADTPGFGLPTLDRVPSAGLAQLFPEFRAARAAAPGGGCRFVDCMHVMEPGCAVNEAGLERYPHYLKFLAEVKAREDYDVRVMQLAKKQREGAVKVKTGRGGETRFEARLESKKHRVTSRKRAKQSLMRATAEDEEEDGDTGRGNLR